MRYAILRIQKHTAIATVRRSGRHKGREQDTPNADPALTPANETEGANTSPRSKTGWLWRRSRPPAPTSRCWPSSI